MGFYFIEKAFTTLYSLYIRNAISLIATKELTEICSYILKRKALPSFGRIDVQNECYIRLIKMHEKPAKYKIKSMCNLFLKCGLLQISNAEKYLL